MTVRHRGTDTHVAGGGFPGKRKAGGKRVKGEIWQMRGRPISERDTSFSARLQHDDEGQIRGG